MADTEDAGIVVIDDDLCQGHGRCYSLAPDLFEWSPETDHGRVIVARVRGEQLSEARRVALECPERAISVLPDDGEAGST